MFYVYVLKRPDGRAFYVGKGKGDRSRRHFHRSHNPIVNRIIEKISAQGGACTCTVVLETVDEAKALKKEIGLIRAYGRLNAKTGILANLTDGGEGVSGLMHSEETKRKASERMKGNVISLEQREKISKANIGKVRTEEAKQKYRQVGIKRGESEAYRNARAESTRLDWAKDPKRSETHSDYQRTRWADPAFKQMIAVKNRAAAKVQWTDPNAKQRIMDARKPIWQSAEFRANASLKQKNNWEDPEYRKRMGEQRRQQWADPLKRAALIAAQRLGRLMKREVHPS